MLGDRVGLHAAETYNQAAAFWCWQSFPDGVFVMRCASCMVDWSKAAGDNEMVRLLKELERRWEYRAY